MSLRLTAIAAVSRNGVIGDGGKIPWDSPEDRAYFRDVTMGHTLIMGRKTFESLPEGKLPGRGIIVLTRDTEWTHPDADEVVHSVEEALDLLTGDAYVAGGAEIYSAFAPHLTDLDITIVGVRVPRDDGNTLMPFEYTIPGMLWIHAEVLDHLNPSLTRLRAVRRTEHTERGEADE